MSKEIVNKIFVFMMIFLSIAIFSQYTSAGIFGENPLINVSTTNVHVVTDTVLVTVSSGKGFNTTLTTIDFQLTNIIVTAPGTSDTFNFEAHENTSGRSIDADRIFHIGEWNILKSYGVETDLISYNITNASADGVYTVRLRYVK